MFRGKFCHGQKQCMKNDGILGRSQGQQKMIIHFIGAKQGSPVSEHFTTKNMELPLRIKETTPMTMFRHPHFIGLFYSLQRISSTFHHGIFAERLRLAIFS